MRHDGFSTRGTYLVLFPLLLGLLLHLLSQVLLLDPLLLLSAVWGESRHKTIIILQYY
jgi:hypothetical protein